MPLGTEVNLGPDDFVLDGVPAPPLKGAKPPVFGPCLLWPTAGWMKTPLGMELDLGPGHIVLDVDPAPPPRKGHLSLPPSFLPMSIVATVAHLSYC